ncbi:GAF domain-containing protein [Streptomyces sp. S.PB5]|uniref:GAF domain-containing protein n=1 Tax=Streptomyces sp. S.PB5 TaxID=3020844 RepID=UPI0025B0B0AA|nr:GAF domain-containing protein [Streptomyces sp. S.PB5]MDN3020713.1 GAF domain-containing protein [Streptomyces sp. S.PB5]
MAKGDGPLEHPASAERRAAAARARFAHETANAERHELLAGQAVSEPLRNMHVRIAALHRSSADCHRTAARLQDEYLARLADWAVGGDVPEPLFMSGVAEACGTSSAALTLVGATFDDLALAASDEPSRAAQELEFLLGEGPARDATRGNRPVSASGRSLAERWPGYGPAVLELGILEVAAVPLSMSDICVGALAVFDPGPGVIGSTAFIRIAEALTRTMILSRDADPGLYGATDLRLAVHQAAGMVAVQLECGVHDALELIKARAFTENTSAGFVATRIISGELRLG